MPTVSFNPAYGATGVALSTNITITFSEAVRLINDAALTDANVDALITLKDTDASGVDIAFDATVNAGKTVITIDPNSNFSSGQIVYVAIGATVENAFGNAIAASHAMFADAHTTPPVVNTFSPADGATAVTANSNLVITFSEHVHAVSGNIYLKKSSNNSTVQTFDVTSEISGSSTDTITINPSSNLASATGYYVQIDSSAFDDAFSNSYAGINDTSTWNFTVADTTRPTGSISINNAAVYTNSRSVTLSLSASDNFSGVSQMMISNSSTFQNASWESYATSKSWTLTSGDGTKTVYVVYEDGVGNASETYFDTIILDTTPPPAPTISSSSHPDESKWYKNNDPVIGWTEPDDLSGISGYSHLMDRSSTTTPDETSEGEGRSKGYGDIAEGTWYFHVRAADGVGHWGETDHYRINVDTNPPEVTLLDYPTEIVIGDTARVAVTFTWIGSDPDGLTPVEELLYQYKLEGHPGYQDWSGWTLATTEIYTLPSGNYTFKVRARDEAGNYPEEDDAATAKSSFTVSISIVIYPNPCYPDREEIVTIANLPLNSEVRIYIYDLAGNLIRTLGESEATVEGGSKTATWDLRNDNEEQIAAGIYIFFIPAATEEKIIKIAIIK